MGVGASTNGQASPELMKLQSDFAEANTKIDSIYKNNNNLATQINLNSAVLPLAKTSDMTNLVQKSDLTALTSSLNMDNLVQKSDLAGIAQKTDLAGIAQKTDLAGIAQKNDLASVAQKSDLANVAQKTDLANIQCNANINTSNLATKNDISGLGQCSSTGNSGSSNPQNIQNDVMISLNKAVSAYYGYTPNPGDITFDNCPFGWRKVNEDEQKINSMTRIGFYDDSVSALMINKFKCIQSPSVSYNVISLDIQPKKPLPSSGNTLRRDDSGMPILSFMNDSNIYFNPPYRGNSNLVSSYHCPNNSELYSYKGKPICVLNLLEYANEICPDGANSSNFANIIRCNNKQT